MKIILYLSGFSVVVVFPPNLSSFSELAAQGRGRD